MMARMLIAGALCVTFVTGSPIQAQQSDGNERRFGDRRFGDRDDGRSDEERQAERTQRRQQWRERMNQFRDATPDQRRDMRNDRYVRMATETYELDDGQVEMVRGEIQAMDAERREAMGPEAEEYDQLRNQMSEFWMTRMTASEEGGRPDWRSLRDDPGFTKLRERMREIERKNPFDFEASRQRIEAKLPEDQVKKGRAKWEERTSRWTRGREGRDRRSAEAERARERITKALAEADKVGASDKDRAEILRKAMQRTNRRGRGDRRGRGERRRNERRTESTPRPATPPAPKPAAPRALHPWEIHVNKFIERQDLSEAQTASARSILKDALRRADQTERANADRVAAAKRMTDRKAREKRLAELKAPTDRLFEELKTRLGTILTAAQRSKAANKKK